jgi:hypothetical protein
MAEADGGRPKMSQVFRAMGRWLAHHIPEAIVFAFIGAAVAWLINIILMAIRYEGYTVTPGAPATGQSNIVSGSLFWIVASAVFFGIVSYRREVGGKRFWAEVRNFPRGVAAVVQSDGGRAIVHLLWGFAGSMLAAQLVSPSLGLALAAALIIAMPSVLGDIIADVAERIWGEILKAVAPSRRGLTPPVAMMVGQFGVVIAFVVAFVFAGRFIKILMMLAAAVGAFILSQAMKRPPAATTALFLFTLVVALALLLSPSPAAADDGGWLECGGTLAAYLRCGAAGGVLTVVRYSAEGAFASFIGAILGAALGGALGELPRGRFFRFVLAGGEPPPPPQVETPGESQTQKPQTRRRKRKPTTPPG